MDYSAALNTIKLSTKPQDAFDKLLRTKKSPSDLETKLLTWIGAMIRELVINMETMNTKEFMQFRNTFGEKYQKEFAELNVQKSS